jgi:transposase-like protein
MTKDMIEKIKCPKCDNKNIVKKGKQKRKTGYKQLYLCKNCGKKFTDQSLKHKTHHPQVIYSAINFYNLGNTYEKTSKIINKQFKIKTGKTTIYSWIHEYKNLCPIHNLRKNFLKKNNSKITQTPSNNENVLFTKRFEHENLDYEFMYHTYKLDVLAREQFPDLAEYITRFEKGCPDVFFEVGERCSNPTQKIDVKTRKENNLACKMTNFAVQAANENRERHKMVEKFMLINDKATIACEVPVWYWDKKLDNGVTGHIDLIQVRNNLVYVMDYKPNSSKDKKAPGQLYQYALALSFRTKIPLSSMRCAWFDKKLYYEYNPDLANAQPINKKR